jgi:predicted acyltransferase
MPELGVWRCPIIKHIWTSSMVLWAGGLSYLLLGVFSLVIDVWQIRRWSFPFIVIGANAIFAYFLYKLFGSNLHDMAMKVLGGLLALLSGTGNVALVRLSEAAAHSARFAVLWLILWYLYRNKTFIRI